MRSNIYQRIFKETKQQILVLDKAAFLQIMVTTMYDL
jgi:hypothetical protein